MSSAMVFLSVLGDPIEKEGFILGLGTTFPRYAEFWLKYVYPNRHPEDSSKLREKVPAKIEDLFNAHYSVWYHLTIAYRQLKSLDSPLVEYGDILFHLASAIDLIEQVFVRTIEIQTQIHGKPFIKKLTKEEYKIKAHKFWKDKYLKGFGKFEDEFKPVGITFHNVTRLFCKNMPKNEAYKSFAETTNTIKSYRNQLAHNIPPINLVAESKHIPKPNHIQKYAGGHYSSVEINREHFAPVEQVIKGLADDFVKATNALWETLLEEMSGIEHSPNYQELFEKQELLAIIEDTSSESVSTNIMPTKQRNPPNPGGTIDYNSIAFSANPSGIKIIPKDSDDPLL